MEFLPEFLHSSWAAVTALTAAVAVVIANFKKASKGATGLLQSIQDWAAPPKKSVWPVNLHARFASTRGDLFELLQLRQRVFTDRLKMNVISSDDSYWKTYQRNKFAFSIVSQARIPIGYWGLIPVSQSDFEKFVAGKSSHAEMLENATLSWEEADPDNLYLYYIGAVSLDRNSLHDDEPKTIRYMEYKVIADAILVAYDIAKSATIKGIAVYASTLLGQRIVEKKLIKNGFHQTGVLADEKSHLSEILVIRDEDVRPCLKALHKKHIERYLKDGVYSKRMPELSTWLRSIVLTSEQKKEAPPRDNRELQSVCQLIQKFDETIVR